MSNFASSKPVILKNVRLDYFDLYKAGKPLEENGKWKFKIKAIIDAGSEAEAAAKAGMAEAATALWGANAKTVVAGITANSKALRDGNTQIDGNGATKPAYAGKMFISAANDTKPQVIAPKMHNGKFVTITEDGRASCDGIDVTSEIGYQVTAPYRGCYVNAKVTFVAGKSIKTPTGIIPNQVYAKLEAVQFLRDGEAFGSGPTSAEGFGDEEVMNASTDDGLF